VQDLRARLDREAREVVLRESVEQVGEALNLFGVHRLAHQRFDLAGDLHLAGTAREEIGEHRVLVGCLHRGHDGVAHRLERSPLDFAENRRQSRHWCLPLLAERPAAILSLWRARRAAKPAVNASTSTTPATRNPIGPVTSQALNLWITAPSYRLRSMPSVKTNVTELPDSRVRVEAEVPAEEVERQIQQAARQLGRQLRVPGFRKGKVPPPVVIRRLGRDAVLDEALRSSLGSWYVDAIDEAGIAPVGDPELDVGELPAEGQPLAFSIEIGVRPRAKLGEYKGLEVGRREPLIGEDAIDQEIEGMRDRFATLETAERPAQTGDYVVMDYVGKIDGEPFEGGEGRDQLLELGSGRLIPGFEEQLTGASAGDQRTVEVTFPEDYAGDLGGQRATFDVAVNEVKTKLLPELTDDFAADAGGFDTIAELREDVAERLKEVQERAIEREFEESVLDAAVAQAEVELPDKLVHARAHELLEQTLSTLARRGISKDAYLRIAGKDEETLAHEAEPDAAQALRREAVLAAIIEAEGIEPSDEDVLAMLGPSAERDGVAPDKLLEQLRGNASLERVREDVARSQAIDLLVREATPISVDQAQAREKLWTPGKEGSEPGSGRGSGQLWTPGS
jgi:trigger factor